MSDYYLDKWAGDFGEKYTERCDVSADSRITIFNKIFDMIDPIDSALECGCNKGHNLEAITKDNLLMCMMGLEPNKEAIKRSNFPTDIVLGNIYDIPFIDNAFDFVFTSGVLIHIPADKLELAMSEMARASDKYVCMIEYFSENEEGKEYRDFDDKEGVWSRDYGAIFKSRNPDMKLVTHGKISDLGNDGWGFSECDYWIFKK